MSRTTTPSPDYLPVLINENLTDHLGQAHTRCHRRPRRCDSSSLEHHVWQVPSSRILPRRSCGTLADDGLSLP